MTRSTRREFLKVAAACGLSEWKLEARPLPASSDSSLPQQAPAAAYILRFYLPDEEIERVTKDLIVFCRQNRIRHVCIFTFNGYDIEYPLQTLPEARQRVPLLGRAFELLRQAGITPSINLMAIIGQVDFGMSQEGRFPFQFMVGHDGTQTHCSACPLDPRWYEYAREIFRLYASLKPEIIYFDDDFRYHNHPPATFGCFCPLHLEAMSKRLGRKVTREELLDRILVAKPQPTPERLEWYALLSETFVNIVRMATREVHALSPATQIGFMTSNWAVHAIEGRNWKALLGAAGEFHRPVLRLHMPPYGEGLLRDIPALYAVLRGPLSVTQASTRITPELENYSYTRFVKSAQYTRLQLALSFLLRIPETTVNIFGISDNPLQGDVAHGRVLGESYDYFQGLLNVSWNCPVENGVQLVWSDQPVLRRTLSHTNYPQLAAKTCWEGALELMGFSTTFGASQVAALSRDLAIEKSDEELRALCSGGLLLDAGAAEELAARGFAKWTGVSTLAPIVGANAEEILDREWGGPYAGQFMTLVYVPAGTRRRLTILPEAKAITRLCGVRCSFSSPGMVIYENSLGGRICTLPFEGGTAVNNPGFRNWRRQFLLLRTLEWLYRGGVPLFVRDAANVFPFRRDGPEGSMVAIANLSSDGWESLSWQMAAERTPKEILLVGKGGGLEQVQAETRLQDGYLHVAVKRSTAPLDLACFYLRGI